MVTDCLRQAIKIVEPFYKVKEIDPVAEPKKARTKAQVRASTLNRRMQRIGGKAAARNKVLQRRIDRPAGAVQGRNKDGLSNVAGEIGKKRGVALKFLKGVNMALGIAFTAFQAWDLAEHWNEMSGVQKGLAVLQCALTFIVAICDILACVFPATACIPVIGAVCAVICLIVGLLITFVFGDRAPQKPPPTYGEQWVIDKKKQLPSWPDPPTPVLDYKVTKDSSGRSGQIVQLKLTATNNSGSDIELIPLEEFNTTDNKIEDQTDTRNKWCKAAFNVPTGSDPTCWFSTPKMAYEPTIPQTKNTEGKVYLESDATGITFAGSMNTPNGEREKLTGWEMQCKAPPSTGTTTTGAKTHLKLANGKSFFMTWVGKLNAKGETVMQLAETRPGVVGCVKLFTLSRD